MLMTSPAVFATASHSIAKSKPAVSHEKIEPQCYYVKKHIKGHHYRFFRVCTKRKDFDQRLKTFLKGLSSEQHSVLEKRIAAQKQIQHSRYGLALFEPTYILPFYYTGNPDQAVYIGTTPENQRIENEEFKAQVSFQLELWQNMFKSPISLNASYTQLSYWQVYAKSHWFRETNYEPAVFLSESFTHSTLGYLGVVHQSNGRGGLLERSWNRLFADFMFSGEHWFISIKPWILIFRTESSDLHNPDICKYLGHGRIVLAVKYWGQELTVNLRNTIFSGFKRGAITVGYSFPILGKVHGFVQVFSGYGQSLIEYNHYTNSVGLGIIVNNWI